GPARRRLAGGQPLRAGVDYVLPEDELKKLYVRDVAGAKQLLAQAGFPNGFDAELTGLNLGNVYVAPAELAQQNLKDVGINGTIKLVDAPTWSDNVKTRGEHQFYSGAISPTGVTNLDLYSKFYANGPRNSVKLNDPKLNEMIDRQALLSRDPEGRKRLLQDIQ